MGFPKVFCDAVGKRINAGDMLVSRLSAREKSCESRWHRGWR